MQRITIITIKIIVIFSFKIYSQEDSIFVYAIDHNTNQKLLLKPNQVLTYSQNFIEIDFKKQYLKGKFTYYIKGIHPDKILINPAQKAYYGNLQGGDYYIYILKDDTEVKSIKFTIESAFWQEWWFILSIFAWIVGIIGLIIYFSLLFRFRQQTKLQRVRNDIASDLHDDVGATLSSISFFGEMMRSKVNKNAPKEEILPLLDKLISTSKETIETMRGVVWTINPNNDNAIDFFGKLESFGKEMLAAKGIAFEFNAEGFDKLKLPLEVQRNLFLFYKEAINNTAKHSKATNVTVTFKSLPTGEGFRVGLFDNGTGFIPTDHHEGHGLKSLKKRADELEGKLEIESAVGKGTKITLTFPLN